MSIDELLKSLPSWMRPLPGDTLSYWEGDVLCKFSPTKITEKWDGQPRDDKQRFSYGKKPGGKAPHTPHDKSKPSALHSTTHGNPKRNPPKEKAWVNQPHQALREYLAQAEFHAIDVDPAHGYLQYKVNADGNNAIGRYQITNTGLEDIGAKKRVNSSTWKWNKDSDFFDRFHITSDKEFLNNPNAQEAAMTAYIKRLKLQTDYITSKYNGAQYVGVSGETITVTQAGILAAAHRRGSTKVKRYFEQYHAKDTKGYTLIGANAEIETRLREAQQIAY